MSKKSTWRTKSPLTTSIMDAMIDCVYGKLGVVTEVTPHIVICVFSGDLYVGTDGYVYNELEYVPYDMWDEDIWDFKKATGREYYDGERWWPEYREVLDDEYVD